jgi:hypothetical protein
MTPFNREAVTESIENYRDIIAMATDYAYENKPSDRGYVNGSRSWNLDRVFWNIEDAQFQADWSMYIGCGDTDYTSTCFNINDFVKE